MHVRILVVAYGSFLLAAPVLQSLGCSGKVSVDGGSRVLALKSIRARGRREWDCVTE